MSVRTLKLALVAVVALCASTALAHSGGPSPGYTGAPGEFTCRQCHSTFPLDDGVGSVAIEGVPASYAPGATYTITIRVERPGRQRWGFQLTALTGALDGAGSFQLVDASKTQLRTDDGRTYVEHKTAGTYAGTTGGAAWTVRWTAPAAGAGVVDFYAAGNAANGNGLDTGDNIYTTFVEAAESVVATPFANVTAASGLAAATGGTGVAWTDVDGDGDLDVAVADGQTVRVFRNDGDGTFTASVLDAPGARAVAWGDGDGDGRADLLVATATGVRALRNTVAGFVADNRVPALGPSSCVAWVDVDGDGDLDAFVGVDADAVLLRNDGESFVDVTSAVGLANLSAVRVAAWADDDGDGRADVVVSGDGFTRLFRQTATGAFEDETTAAGLDAIGSATDAAWLDADGDGRLDLAMATPSGARLFVCDADGYADATDSAGLSNVAATALAAEDANGDGRIDLVASTSGAVRLLRSQGPTFVDATSDSGLDAAPGGIASWADVDGDGHADLLTVSPTGVALLLNPSTTPSLSVRAVTVAGADAVGSVVSFDGQARWLSGGGAAAQGPARGVFATPSIVSGTALAVFPDGESRERTATTGAGAALALEEPDAPRITSVAVATKNGVVKLLVDGAGLVTSVTVVEVDGERMDVTKYPKKRRNADGTSSRITGTDTAFNQLVPRGVAVHVTVFDPMTGVRSTPYAFTR